MSVTIKTVAWAKIGAVPAGHTEQLNSIRFLTLLGFQPYITFSSNQTYKAKTLFYDPPTFSSADSKTANLPEPNLYLSGAKEKALPVSRDGQYYAYRTSTGIYVYEYPGQTYTLTTSTLNDVIYGFDAVSTGYIAYSGHAQGTRTNGSNYNYKYLSFGKLQEYAPFGKFDVYKTSSNYNIDFTGAVSISKNALYCAVFGDYSSQKTISVYSVSVSLNGSAVKVGGNITLEGTTLNYVKVSDSGTRVVALSDTKVFTFDLIGGAWSEVSSTAFELNEYNSFAINSDASILILRGGFKISTFAWVQGQGWQYSPDIPINAPGGYLGHQSSVSDNAEFLAFDIWDTTNSKSLEIYKSTITEVTYDEPIITSGQSFLGQVGVFFNKTAAITDSANRPVTSWAATGLPSWATINTTTGAITGTPQDTGSATITLTATGPGGTSAATTATISIAVGAPIITAGQSFAGKVGVAFTSATPALDDALDRPATSWSATGLPAGLSLNTTTGAITGTPTAKGSFPASFTATGGGGTSAARSVAFTITDGVPIITASQTASGTVGTAFSKTFSLTDSTNRSVTSWAATGLPSWATLNTTTGAITGTPQDTGSATITLTATGPGGTSAATTATISIAVGAPIITAGQSFAGKVGVAFSQTPTLDDALDRPATSWAIASGALPAGLSLNTTTGAITGTPTAKGLTTFYAGASGPGGGGPGAAIYFTIAEGRPVFTYPSTNNLRINRPVSLNPTTDAVNRPVASWSATGLPAGISINAATGQITGTPTAEGTTTATITATGPGGSSSEEITFLVIDSLPLYRGATSGRAIFAGATEGKAIYYGSKLLWNVPWWEPSTLSNNLLAFYRLNAAEGGTLSLLDTSGNNRTLTNTNETALTSGVFQGAASFTGNSQFLTATIPFSPAQPYTISMWVNVSTLKNFFSLIAGSTMGTLNIHGDSSGGLSWNNGAFGDFSHSGFFIAEQWMHCVFVRGSSNSMTVYKNGSFVKTATGSTSYESTALVDIGNVRFMGGFQFSGKIDAVGIWDRALSTAEIAQLYNNGAGMEI